MKSTQSDLIWTTANQNKYSLVDSVESRKTPDDSPTHRCILRYNSIRFRPDLRRELTLVQNSKTGAIAVTLRGKRSGPIDESIQSAHVLGAHREDDFIPVPSIRTILFDCLALRAPDRWVVNNIRHVGGFHGWL